MEGVCEHCGKGTGTAAAETSFSCPTAWGTDLLRQKSKWRAACWILLNVVTNQETRDDWWHYIFASTGWRMTEKSQQPVASSSAFQGLLQVLCSGMACADASNFTVPWSCMCVTSFSAWCCASLMTRERPSCVRSPWPAPALLCDAPVAAAPSHDQCLGFYTMAEWTCRGVKCFVPTADERWWCYCSYVWSDAMCTFLYKWLFVLKMELFYLLLLQEETQATPG